MRVAYFSPLRPQTTGISDYSEELLPFLADYMEIDIFVDGFTPSSQKIRDRFAVFDCAEFAARHVERPYNVNLYQMGNSSYHAEICRMLYRYPGIVVLHDAWLHHLFVEVAIRDQNPSVYLRELSYAAGPSEIEVGYAALHNERVFPFFEYPLIDRVIDASLGIIVHSNYAREQVERRSRTEVAVVPQHIIAGPAMSAAERQQSRREHGIPANCILIGAFGHATPPKRLDVLLRSVGRLHDVIPEIRLVIVGEVNPVGWLNPLIDDLELGSFVTLTGAVTVQQFQRFIASTDIGVNLRYPTVGETSATALRFLASGIPVVVSDIGAFSELPLETCVRIPTDKREEDLLFEALHKLVVDDDLRGRMGSAGLALIGAKHTPGITASAYSDFMDQVLTSATTNVRQVGWPVEAPDRPVPAPGRLAPNRPNSELESEISRTLAELGISSSLHAISDEWP